MKRDNTIAVGREIAIKTKQFQVLLEGLRGLTAIQRTALLTALKSRNSADDVTTLLEVKFAKVPACGHCGAEIFSKWGVGSGFKSYMCKMYNRTFRSSHTFALRFFGHLLRTAAPCDGLNHWHYR